MKINDIQPIVDFIKQRKPNFQPKVALILGSGLGELADKIEDAVKIPFGEIPHFFESTIPGHKGQLVLGMLGNVPVACMQGRIHLSEGANSNSFKIFVRTLKVLGCETIFITNSAGSLRTDALPGQLMLINDHLSLHITNPLCGPNDDEFGPRFVAMSDAYDPALRKRFHQIAEGIDIKLHEGVYVCLSGPCFETPAEIKALRTLGADLVGMSTVPEVILARHCGMRVAAISSITNLAAGMSDEILSHEGTLHFGAIAAKSLSQLVINVLESLAHDPC